MLTVSSSWGDVFVNKTKLITAVDSILEMEPDTQSYGALDFEVRHLERTATMRPYTDMTNESRKKVTKKLIKN